MKKLKKVKKIEEGVKMDKINPKSEIEDDIYYDDFREEMLENDEISVEEEAFMRGYMNT